MLRSALQADVRRRVVAEPVAAGQFSSGVTFGGNIPIVAAHAILIALQLGLTCANCIGLSKSKWTEALQECTKWAPTASGGVQST